MVVTLTLCNSQHWPIILNIPTGARFRSTLSDKLGYFLLGTIRENKFRRRKTRTECTWVWKTKTISNTSVLSSVSTARQRQNYSKSTPFPVFNRFRDGRARHQHINKMATTTDRCITQSGKISLLQRSFVPVSRFIHNERVHSIMADRAHTLPSAYPTKFGWHWRLRQNVDNIPARTHTKPSHSSLTTGNKQVVMLVALRSARVPSSGLRCIRPIAQFLILVKFFFHFKNKIEIVHRVIIQICFVFLIFFIEKEKKQLTFDEPRLSGWQAVPSWMPSSRTQNDAMIICSIFSIW